MRWASSARRTYVIIDSFLIITKISKYLTMHAHHFNMSFACPIMYSRYTLSPLFMMSCMSMSISRLLFDMSDALNRLL